MIFKSRSDARKFHKNAGSLPQHALWVQAKRKSHCIPHRLAGVGQAINAGIHCVGGNWLGISN